MTNKLPATIPIRLKSHCSTTLRLAALPVLPEVGSLTLITMFFLSSLLWPSQMSRLKEGRSIFEKQSGQSFAALVLQYSSLEQPEKEL